MRFEAHVPNPSPAAVLGSKASGEPPMALGAACAFAVRDAIRAVCTDRGSPLATADFELPLTVERVQRACGVSAADCILK